MFTFNSTIPVTVHPLFIVIALWIGFIITQDFTATLVVAAIVFLSVLIHEYGHALTAKLFKQRPRITLQVLGGLTERKGPPLKKWQEFLVVFNGPLFGFCLSLFAFYLNTIYPSSYLQITGEINLIWTIFNLLPILPMDGGHLLRIFLEGIFGLKGLKASMIISLALGGVLSLAAFAYSQIFIGIILAIFTFESFRGYKQVASMSEADTDSAIQKQFDEAESDFHSENYPKARTLYEMVREKSKSGSLYNFSTFRLAQIESMQGEYSRAYSLIKPVYSNLNEEGILLYQRLAFETGDYKTVLKIGGQEADQMALNAMAAAQLNDIQAAKGWIKAYLNAGGDPEILKDKRLDPVRPYLDR